MDAEDHLPPQHSLAPGPGRLVIELRPGQRLLVNGADLLFRSRGAVVLCNRARFLFGRQLLDPAEATTPARRFYLALQGAYAGPEEARVACEAAARRIAAEQMESRSAEGRALLREALAELGRDRGRAALLLARRLFAEDDAEAASRAA
ncbi:flagellar biosynthesis repressor FlbT [Falsiroseomonas sp.]|uniref:flagellar biosynthesis repressor FlbT n=1 Tax=Falsiroseomonas sp. TaxID=2870721 RepID=UPI0035643ADF